MIIDDYWWLMECHWIVKLLIIHSLRTSSTNHPFITKNHPWVTKNHPSIVVKSWMITSGWLIFFRGVAQPPTRYYWLYIPPYSIKYVWLDRRLRCWNSTDHFIEPSPILLKPSDWCGQNNAKKNHPPVTIVVGGIIPHDSPVMGTILWQKNIYPHWSSIRLSIHHR